MDSGLADLVMEQQCIGDVDLEGFRKVVGCPHLACVMAVGLVSFDTRFSASTAGCSVRLQKTPSNYL